MGFFYVPSPGADLYRLLQYMHGYARLSLSEIFLKMQNDASPLSILYYFIIGKFNVDGLLPAVSAFITYSNIFYVFKQHIKNNEDIDRKNVALTLFFIMSTGFFIHAISNIRYSFIYYSLINTFNGFICNNNKNNILYIYRKKRKEI